MPASLAEQAAACFDNLRAILAASGRRWTIWCASPTNLTAPADLAAYMAPRDRYVGAAPPASTLMVVQVLARPQFKIEIEALAATYK